jgi:hypothetical protein
MDTADVVTAYWDAVGRRDWAAHGAQLDDQVVYEAPQSRERVRGRAAYLRFCTEGFPGDWDVMLVKVVAGPYAAATEIRSTEDGRSQPAVTFFDIKTLGYSKLINRITEYWPDPYEPPAGRAGLAERY